MPLILKIEVAHSGLIDKAALLEKMLRVANAHLDKDFGIQDVNPAKGVYCVRVDSLEDAKELLRIEDISDWKLFSDAPIHPTKD